MSHPPQAGTAVFVDDTGRKSRRIALVANVMGVIAFGYVMLMLATLARAPWVPDLDLPLLGQPAPNASQSPPDLGSAAVLTPIPVDNDGDGADAPSSDGSTSDTSAPDTSTATTGPEETTTTSFPVTPPASTSPPSAPPATVPDPTTTTTIDRPGNGPPSSIPGNGNGPPSSVPRSN